MKGYIYFLFLTLSIISFSQDITISAAASLKEYLEKNITDYKKLHPEINFFLNLGGSGTLKKQIEQGAPCDIIFLANSDYVESLEKNGFVENKQNILENKLVLIENKNISNNNLLAMGNPNFVPAGKYSQEVLNNISLPFNYEPIYTKDVRAALNYVEIGEVKYGIVYLSDTKLLKNSEVITIFNSKYHSPIIYPAAVLKNSKNKKIALNFINFLKDKDWNE
nr:molybdate ABC transporter substrate-binding protein [uncultured Cetobacterium sp.]